jgi:hypothetical protein
VAAVTMLCAPSVAVMARHAAAVTTAFLPNIFIRSTIFLGS